MERKHRSRDGNLMAKELLAISEEDLHYVIAVIREGLNTVIVPEPLYEFLTEWCDAEEGYLEALGTDE